MLDHPLCEEIIPDIQSKLSLAHHEPISSHPDICHLRKETNILSTAVFIVVVE